MPKDKKKPWPKPESGGKPKRITTRNEPGGPKTPGAKKKKRTKKGMRDAIERGIKEADGE